MRRSFLIFASVVILSLVLPTATLQSYVADGSCTFDAQAYQSAFVEYEISYALWLELCRDGTCQEPAPIPPRVEDFLICDGTEVPPPGRMRY